MSQTNAGSSNEDLISEIKQSELFCQIDESIWQSIAKDLEIVELEKGQFLFHQGDPADAMYVLILGQLEVTMSDEDGRKSIIRKIEPYMPVGEIQALSGGRRTASVYAQTETRLIKIPTIAVERMAADAPDSFQRIVNIARKRLRNEQLRFLLPGLFGTLGKTELAYIERHCEWVHLCRGDILCRQGDPGDCLYIIVSGRLRVVKEDENRNKKNFITIGRGEIVGEIALLTEGVRIATLIATRDTDLVKIPGTEFERLAEAHPRAIISIGRKLVQRIIKTEASHREADAQMNLAIVAICHDTPLADFAQHLVRELSSHMSTLHLNSLRLNNMLGIPETSVLQEEDPFTVRLSVWFDEQEARYDVIVYEADISASVWTRRCLRNADKVLVLVPGDRPATEVNKGIASFLQADEVESSNRVLVFVHSNGTAMPSKSSQWMTLLQAQEHYHLRWNRNSDIQRIARFLTGNSFNVVLSGGAACGLAHIGVLRALEDNGVPIDSISGTSMGAVIAAQYAMGMGYSDLISNNRWLWVLSKPMDITLPLISFLKGRKIDQVGKKLYGETQIQDLWLPFFCISTNLTSAGAVVHREGPLFNAIRATASVPGLVPPEVRNNEILVDGGIMNNLPVDIARRFFKGKVIAVDVTDAKALSASQEEFPSPWKILWSRLVPFKNRVNVPGILDIIYRSAVVGSRNKTERASQDADFYLRIPLDRFKFLEFKSFDEIVDAGYQYSSEKIREWKEKQCVK